ncbi:MAG: ABC transporter ATP-binding protein [Desulfurococcales archaeon]|nr:ABC transporter ATP-binding protein [Desulfurococcales archaeon]
MARVELRDVVKRFGKTVAVDHVSLEINDKEFFILLGPSGCGKTTTLRLVAGLEYPDEGSILIDGEDVTYSEPKDRNVAMVFQNYALYPNMSVYDNIAFPLKIRKKQLGITDDEIRKSVTEVARLLRIEDLLNRKPSQLSGGQQQRVALARALVRRPKIWLMDEPLSNLDALLRIAMRAELKRLQKELGITTIYVTHDQAEAMSMADRIAVMNKGRVIQVGDPKEVFLEPRHVFVATFLGSPPMNIIECVIEAIDNGLLLSCPGFTKEIKGVSSDEVDGVKGKVYLGIRPEFISISKSPLPGTIKGVVYVVEPLGTENIVSVNIIGDIIVKVKVGSDINVNTGETIYLYPDWKRISIFDSDTGKLLTRITKQLREEYTEEAMV